MEAEEVTTARDTARSLLMIYKQMPVAVQDEFRRLLEDQEEDTAGWMRLSEEVLQDIWEAPEEDYWDELYAKQHGNH